MGMIYDKSLAIRQKKRAKRGKLVKIFYNGQIISAFKGETIATALIAAGHLVSGYSNSQPRGVYCNIGVCHSCVMTVNGISNVQICKTLVTDGCQVESQYSRRRKIK
jgi:sarcosine oxidase subunit alpha